MFSLPALTTFPSLSPQPTTRCRRPPSRDTLHSTVYHFTITGKPMDIPGTDGEDCSGLKKLSRIMDREDEYRRRRLNRIISPARSDPFVSGEATPDASVRTYGDIMKEHALQRQKEEFFKAAAKKHHVEEKLSISAADTQKRKNGWDHPEGSDGTSATKKMKVNSDWDAPDSAPGIGSWDATLNAARVGDAAPSKKRKLCDDTSNAGQFADPGPALATLGATPAGRTWDATPKLGVLATPTPKRQNSRWDETPKTRRTAPPLPDAVNPAAAFSPGITPIGGVDLATPIPGSMNLRGVMTPELYNLLNWERDIEERNRPLSDEDLDAMFPHNGYNIIEPPSSYIPIRTPV